MMHMHMKRREKPPAAAPPPAFDPLAAAYRAGQEVYKATLLLWLNQERRRRGKAEVAWPEVGQTPARVAWQRGPVRLLHYGAAATKKGAPASGKDAGASRRPLLIVFSLINRPYVVDLLPERSLVGRLGAAGRDVWLLDWGSAADGASGDLAHYTLELLPAAAAEVLGATGADELHVLGYCMGGTLSLMAQAAGKLPAAAHIALAAPVDFDEGGLLTTWCRAPSFDAGEIVRAYGDAPPHLLQPAFKLLDPVGLLSKFRHLADRVEDDAFVRFFLAMETWLEDSVPFPGGAFAEWTAMYRTNALARGELRLGRTAIDLGKLEGPILSLVARGDYIAPTSACLALKRLAPRAEHEVIEQPGGHIGLATGSAAHKVLWPGVARWLDEIDARAPAAPPPRPRPARKGARR
jgi:polyhydroxyalkanoate synthase